MKVLFGISDVQVSPIQSVSEIGTPTYDQPIKVPGTVSLALDNEGENEPFYADNSRYYVTTGAESKTGTLENAVFPDEVLQKIWGFVADQNKNLIEVADPVTKEFGLQFSVNSDVGKVYFTFYRVSGTKPNYNFQTSEDTPQINPQEISITISPIGIEGGKSIMSGRAKPGDTNYATYLESITIPTIAEIESV